MKIAVFGTSNSILKNGYVSGLRFSPYVDTVQQFCLGHSTSVSLPYTTKGVNFDDFDYCLVDFVVNEETFEKFPESHREIRNRLDFLISLLAEKKCVPVAMIMPVQIRVDKPLPVYRLYLEYFREHNFPVFDGYDALRRLMAGSDTPLPSYFRDPSHLSNWAATALGLALGEQLAAFADKLLDRRVSTVRGHTFGYVRFNPRHNRAIPVVTRKSALSTERFLRIGAEERILFGIGEAEAVSGVGLNLGQTNWPLVVRSGEKRSPAFFGKEYFDPTEKRYLFVIRTMPELLAEENYVRLFLKPRPPRERESEAAPLPALIAEVNGVTVRYPQTDLATCALVLKDDTAGDLVTPISDTFFRGVAMTALRLMA